jgi:oligopeptide/dipeptide ABC transporter ATP-binding protein
MTCLSILRLVPQPAGRIVGGQILLEGDDLLRKSDREMREIRGKKISMILQDPMTSLNPVYPIGDQVGEPLRFHQRLDRKSAAARVLEMLRQVRIPSPEVRVREYPHQMSGGMRQRIVGAMALTCRPELLIADEPTTALDVTIQAQFLKLLKEMQRDFNLSLIVVTHDFGIVAKICDRVAVMYAGKIVELAGIRALFNRPRHPYTMALMNSVPKMERKVNRLTSISGQPPDLKELPPGCSFAPRCSLAMDICRKEYPPVSTAGEGHTLTCWLAREDAAGG